MIKCKHPLVANLKREENSGIICIEAEFSPWSWDVIIANEQETEYLKAR